MSERGALTRMSDKKRYFEERVDHWKKVLLVDPKITVQIRYKLEDVGDDEPISESLKLEEMLVTNLEAAFLGPERMERVNQIMRRHDGTWADCDCGSGQYNWFVITFYKNLLKLNGDDYEVFADRCALHECLHVVLWPFASYAENVARN